MLKHSLWNPRNDYLGLLSILSRLHLSCAHCSMSPLPYVNPRLSRRIIESCAAPANASSWAAARGENYFYALNEADLVSHQYLQKHHLNFHIGHESPGNAWRPCPKVVWPWSVNVNRALTSFSRALFVRSGILRIARIHAHSRS